MVQPLFYGKVFAPYRLTLLPFSIWNLIAFLPQTTVPNLALPGTSPPSEGLGEAPSPLSFIPFHYYPKRQLHRFFVVHPFIKAAYKYWEIWGSAVLFTSKPRLPTLLRQAHPLLRRGLGRPLFPLFFFSFGLGKAALSFFKYFRPLPHLLSNIENMSTLFSVKIPLFCPSLQQLMLLSTNSLLFISSLLYPLIPSCSPSSYVYSLPVSPDHYAFL